MQLCGFRFSIYYFNSMKTSISIEKDDIFVIEAMVRVWCLAPLSVISWRSVLLVEETGIPAGNHRPVTSH